MSITSSLKGFCNYSRNLKKIYEVPSPAILLGKGKFLAFMIILVRVIIHAWYSPCMVIENSCSVFSLYGYYNSCSVLPCMIIYIYSPLLVP